MTEISDNNLSFEEESFSCCGCDKKFSDKETTEIHQVVRHKIFFFKCTKNDCTKTFLREEYLKKHIQVYHNSKIEKQHKIEKPYKCIKKQSCIDNKTAFKTEADLNHHLKRHGPKVYICQHCGKGFAIKSYLTSHMRSHTGEKPYKCSQCDRSFSSPSSRSYHESHSH
jgi:KRAB domain-containing zinc finger protein